MDPATGNKSVISSGGFFVDPTGVAIDASGTTCLNPDDCRGDIIVADSSAGPSHLGRIIRIHVDPSTGMATQTIIAENVKAGGVAIEASGHIIAPLDKEVIRVDPVSGAQTSISKDGFFFNLEGVAIDAAGNIIVTNGSVTDKKPRIIRVDPAGDPAGGVPACDVDVDSVCGAQTVVSRNPSGQGNLFHNPFGVAIDSSGDIIVADWSASRVVSVDPVTGVQTLIAGFGGGPSNQPIGVAIVPTLIAKLQAIVNSNPGTALADKVEDAVAKLETAAAELAKTPPDNQAAVGNIEGAVGEIEAAVNLGLLGFDEGTEIMDQLAGVAQELAVQAILDAEARGGDSGDINDADEFLLAGDDLRFDSGLFKDAVNKYKDALAKAEGA